MTISDAPNHMRKIMTNSDNLFTSIITCINIPEGHGKAATVFPDSLSLQIRGRLLARLHGTNLLHLCYVVLAT